MKLLIKKEWKLTVTPVPLLFLLLSALVLVPSYPYYVTFFYNALGIFLMLQAARENRDVYYMALLPLTTIVRTTQESLKTVPQSYREGALGLGAGKWHMIRTVVLPNAVDGIVTGCILAIGRIVGESAALLFTAGFGLVLNGFVESLQSSSATLTVALYVYASERGETAVAFAIATILMVLTFIINFAANLAAKKLKKV